MSGAAALADVRARLEASRPSRPYPLIMAGIESAEGVAAVEEVARSGRADAVYFGAEDYITDLGGRRSPGNAEVLYARSRVALAARLGGLPAIDQVVVDYRDAEGYTAEAATARDMGFAGKLCIHPSQVELANKAFRPTPAEWRHAAAVVRASEEASLAGRGVVSVGGMMVDAPLVARARQILADVLTEEAEPSDG